MIRHIYKNEKLWKGQHAAWCTFAFLVNSLVFWYIVLKCCFQHLCPKPPIAVTAICLIVILADRLYTPFVRLRLTFLFLLDFVVWVLILLSLVLPDENNVCFLGLAVAVNLFDVIYLKELLFDLVRRNYWVYKIYIILKIVYWIIIYGHLIGCIFYAIEMHLLNNQYFGPYAENPALYYQGQILAYTPILMFQNLNRYVYAMYYSFALVSTIAFGDIIGKNYIENIYVMILIILSTIVISLIIEQMFVIFRRKKNRYLQLLNEVRFLSERLKGYEQIPNNFRLQIINYLIDANWKHISEYPRELQQAKEFKTKIIMQSVIANPDLPSFFQKYLLHKLKFTHLPKGILVSSNVPQRQELVSYLVTQGEFWIGYTTYSGRLAGGYVVKKQGMNFGIEQALVGTNDLYRMLSIRTKSSGVVLTITLKEIHSILEQLSLTSFPCDKPIEHYQMAKDKAMFKRHKYQCNVCNTTKHTLIDCPKCHYVVTPEIISEIVNRQNTGRMFRRKSRISKKIKDKHLVASQAVEEKSWRLIEIQRFKDIFNRIRSVNQEQQKIAQKWHKWDIYGQDHDQMEQYENTANDSPIKNMILTVVSPKRIPRQLQ